MFRVPLAAPVFLMISLSGCAGNKARERENETDAPFLQGVEFDRPDAERPASKKPPPKPTKSSKARREERKKHEAELNELWKQGYGFNNPNPDRIKEGKAPLNFNGKEDKKPSFWDYLLGD